MTRHASGSRSSRWHTEDRARTADVSVHAGLADPEEVGDLLRRKTARDGAQHLTLPVGQRGARRRASREDPPGKCVPGENTEERGGRALHQQKVSDRGLRLDQLARFSVRRSLARITSCSKRSRKSWPPQRGQSG